jgi:flagellar basal body-associated protein FliL
MAKEPEAGAAPEAAAAPTPPGEEDAAQPQNGSKSNMLLLIIIGVGLILASSVVTFITVKLLVPKPIEIAQAAVKEDSKAKAEHGGGGGGEHGKGGAGSLLFSLGDIYVNVAETRATRALKVSPVLVLSEPKLADELKEYQSLLRDRIMEAARKMTLDELDGPNGRDNLKKEIISLINMSIKDKFSGMVVDVYFNDFLIQ